MSSLIFISHSRKDKEYADAIVELLLNVGLNKNQIVYTSNPDTGVPVGNNIYDYLKNKISKDAFIVYLLSNNYYSSVACLNEMGAAWMLQNDYDLIVTPKFNLNDEKFQGGVVDSKKLVVSMDNEANIKQFVNRILNLFNINVDKIKISSAIQDYFSSLQKIIGDQKKEKSNYKNTDILSIINKKQQVDSDFVNLAGIIYEMNEGATCAIQQCLYAIYLNKYCEEAYLKIIFYETKRGNYMYAYQMCDIAIKLFPDSEKVYAYSAYLEYNRGSYKKSIEDCNRAIDMNNKYSWAYNIRGCANKKLNYYLNAITDFWWAVYYLPVSKKTKENLILTCKEVGENKLFEEAMLKKEEKDIELCKIYLQCVLLINDKNKKATDELEKLNHIQ